jgi:ABC-type nitrate/sulfonate/bicarbonate transport system substrate-binding protein
MRPTLTRRTLLGTGAAALGAGTLGLGAVRPALAQSAVSLQLSWLHSSQFAGSYIALDRGFWSEAGHDV